MKKNFVSSPGGVRSIRLRRRAPSAGAALTGLLLGGLLTLSAGELSNGAESAPARGRQHPSYQVFVAQTLLPPIYAPDKSTIVVDGKEISLRRNDPQPGNKKSAVADHLGIPVPVLNQALEQASSNPAFDADQAAQQFRTAVLDYKYLQDRWTRYHPPAGTEQLKAKTHALQILQDGQITKAWEMFMALPRPQPPSGFRVVNAGT